MKNNIVVVFSSHLSEEENSKFKNHISKTIGVKHKVVCYSNFNEFSLSEIYNKAITEEIEDNCIFVMCHNDITIKTKNWGKILLNKFNHSNYDIIGVAGSTYLPESGIWWEDKSKMVGIVDHTDGIDVWTTMFSPEFNGIKDVVTIDGLFMSFNPDNIIHKFDESYKGFHYYDLSFCLPNYLDGCNIGVLTSIRILHKSVGITNDKWESNRKQFANQWYYELSTTIFPEYNELYPTLKTTPKVTVIIPTKNNLKYIKRNVYSWINNIHYPNYEIIIADTGSDKEVIEEYNKFLCNNIKLVKYDYYNFAKINNDVVNNHISDDTELLLFCNDDIMLLNDALSRVVEIYNENKETVGTIGIRLHYGNGNVQHNGIIMSKDIQLYHKDMNKTNDYFTGVNYNSFGNTGGFLLINKELFKSFNGFNENYIECFEDVELNMECSYNGKKNITVSDAVGFHYESISRNKIDGKFTRLGEDYLRLKQYIFNKL